MVNLQDEFAVQVYALVARIPRGRLMSYGQIARLCGHPRSARMVGRLARRSPPGIPWQRVVHKDGRLAAGYIAGYKGHRCALEAEGVAVDGDDRADIEAVRWWPPDSWGPSRSSP
jgi:methylated-DNA-protein-cysteine methyltransferase-like protein